MRPTDNVLTALTRISAGAVVSWQRDGEARTTVAIQIIPFGHKMACEDIPAGHAVIKYGEPIGRATVEIHAGEHVHGHNVESQRGRGDLATPLQHKKEIAL
jgi:altronate dehydratase small subunit